MRLSTQKVEMDQFGDIEKSIRKIKRPILSIALTGIILQTLILLAGTTGQRERLKPFSTLEACYYGMRSLFIHDPDKNLLHKSVLKKVKGRHFKSHNITLVKAIGHHHCDVVAKDTKGYRSYRINLEKNPRFIHLYRIFHIQEQQLTNPYQWEDK